MNVVLVVPDCAPKLASAEAQRVVNSGLSPRLLQGATSTQLLDVLLSEPCDLLYLATHGTTAGVLLDDGMLPVSALTALVRARHIRYVFLNTCESREAALQLTRETRSGVIATIGEVHDATAFRTGALFAKSLAELGDVEQAYEASKPGGGAPYHYWPPLESNNMTPGGAPQTAIEYQLGELVKSNATLVVSHHDLDKRLALLEQGQADERAQLKRFADQLDRLETSRTATRAVYASRASIAAMTIIVSLSLIATITLVVLVLRL